MYVLRCTQKKRKMKQRKNNNDERDVCVCVCRGREHRGRECKVWRWKRGALVVSGISCVGYIAASNELRLEQNENSETAIEPTKDDEYNH